MPVGIGEDESALLEVTLVGQDGGKTVSTRALTVPKSGDYYYSDGSVSGQIISGNPDRIPVGIVFYVGDIVAKDSHLKEILGGGNADNYKSDDIHGLVVALKDAGNRTYWQRNYTPTGMSVADANDICGYGNTLQMKEWNEKDSHSGNLIEATDWWLNMPLPILLLPAAAVGIFLPFASFPLFVRAGSPLGRTPVRMEVQTVPAVILIRSMKNCPPCLYRA